MTAFAGGLRSTAFKRALATAAALLACLTASAGTFMDASANQDYLGLVSADKPDSPPFVFSPNALELSGGPATITMTIHVKNLTNTSQTLTVEFGVHHIVTYYGTDVSDGQPGQPGITFKKGDSLHTVQVLAAPPQFKTFTVGTGSSTTEVSFSQTISSCGYYQVDIGRHFRRTHANLSAGFTRVLGCSARLTPGYWKNHQAATTALLPQVLGGYSVSTFAQATAIFDAMKCNAPVDCLAAHLLAAELDIANGSSPCIISTVNSANAFLSTQGYNGPGGTYHLSSADKATALLLAGDLDTYTNDLTTFTC